MGGGEIGRGRHTNPVRGMLPHFADQLGHSIPVLIAASIIELLDVMRGLDCVRLNSK